MSLYLTVDTSAGLSIEDACAEMVILAGKLNVCVQTNFNGIEVFVTPTTLPFAAVAQYNREMAELSKKG